MDGFADSSSKLSQGFTELDASSNAVGLPEGLMGNSEVGHLNIGAGRVVWQDVVRIDKKIKDKELNKVENLTKSLQTAVDGNGRLHFLGLVSDGGVHSHILHLVALLKLAKEMGVPEVYIHFFGDGRDTDPNSGVGHMEHLLKETKEIGLGQIATVVGRYYAMDRDKRWDRVTVAMKAIVEGEGEDTEDVVKTMKERYEKGETDEFLKPIIVGGKDSRVKGEFTFRIEKSFWTEMLQAVFQDQASQASCITLASASSYRACSRSQGLDTALSQSHTDPLHLLTVNRQ